MRRLPLLVVLAVTCAVAGTTAATPNGAKPLADVEAAPGPSPTLQVDAFKDVTTRIDSWFDRNGTRRVHVQLDRPLYRPGETVWVKTWDVATQDLGSIGAQNTISYELVNPRGQVVETKQVQQSGTTATNDFIIGHDAPGGRWALRATLPTGEVDERPFVVSSYQAPQIRKKLDFVREAYGPGERVEALVVLERAGGPLAKHPVRALLQVGGETVLEQTLHTDATGAVLVGAALPRDLASADGLLTILVDDGGVTESISRSVPILLADLELAFFPEGGDLISGLPGRVYFEGRNRHGEPADVSGVIEDDRGARIAGFESLHDGMGRVAFTPAPGRTYTARITAPEGIDATFALPAALDAGCTLRSFDDVRSSFDVVRVGVRCTEPREVLVVGALREQTLGSAAVRATASKDAIVYLKGDASTRQGAVRVTVFDRDRAPLAERLVYRNPGKDLRIDVQPSRERYGPRDEVVLAVRTTDHAGAPVPAELALSVVDDAVLRLADDREGHMLSRLYLEPELIESPKDPAWYFDRDEDLAARGLDLVMGTRGYRRFEWQPVWAPPIQAQLTSASSQSIFEWAGDMLGARRAEPVWADAPMDGPPMDGPPMVAVALEKAEMPEMPEMEPMPNHAPMPDVRPRLAKQVEAPRRQPAEEMQARGGAHAGMAKRDGGWAHGGLMDMGYLHQDWIEPVQYAPVRVFPKPAYEAGFTGVRTDFRDTVHWEPTVVTGADGAAEVRFFLSDALTTFRVTAEGLGGGYAGHGEATLSAQLPVSLATKLPSEVSAGDQLLLPITVSNTRSNPLDVTVSSASSSQYLWASGDAGGTLTVPADSSDTYWLPLDVGQGRDTATLTLQAEGGGLSDTLEQELRIVPPGFPRAWSASGELAQVSKHTMVLDRVVSESLSAKVTWHPSPVSTLLTGMDGLIRTPGGCFEQTSSTNWPNVAILSYLEAHDGDPRLRLKSGQALAAGYEKLTGYQVDAGGFETWGSGPGKEALSAFGLLQFSDMKRVYPVDDRILDRDAKYLLGQRDGKGGFNNSGESAHGYGSAPAAVLDGFITYALVATGHGSKLGPELARQADVARTTKDPYVLALAARSLQASGHDGASPAIKRLTALQDADGSFPGAESSITRSYEANLLVESTALSALALMEAGASPAAGDKAAAWLIANRQGAGTWGATQATALALSALTAHAERSRRPRASGSLWVEVNGEPAGSVSYAPDQAEPITIHGLERLLVEGENQIVLRHQGGEPLPFTVDVTWSAITPASAPGAELALETSLDRGITRMGETVRLNARVDNRTDRVVPSPIARIGLPAGLEAQTWQLRQLQERGEIAFFETRPREVTLYWDGLHAGAAHEVNLDLTALVPGVFTGPASSAYPYYNDDEKAWDAGLQVSIERTAAR